jgi:hypothetical protein
LSGFILKSAPDGSTLEFSGEIPRGLSGYDGASFSVSLRVEGLFARVLVYDIHPDHWSAFFAELAEGWRGWSGIRSQESLEHQLRIEATSDSLGHVRLRVLLRDDPVYNWRADGSIFVEAGQLEEIAQRAKTFFG